MKKSALLLVCVILLSACSDDKGKQVAQPIADPFLVAAPPSLTSRITVLPVAMTPVSETLRVAGQIDFDENRVARIGATVTGRVASMTANIGQTVARGTVLAQITSTELSSQQLAYVRARSSNDLNRRSVERARTLFAAGVISQAELQRRESEYQVTSAEMRAAADQLRLLGLSGAALGQLGAQGAVHSASQVSSTMKGVVVERSLALGQVVQPSDQLFVVADLSTVWAVAQVPEQQVRFVHAGQQVALDIPALGGEKREGRLLYVGQVVDPKTRTVLVRTMLDNADGRLKPSMLATMLVQSDPVNRLTIPASAVVRENNEDHVFVAQGGNRYRLKPVKLGEESKGRRPVLSGLSAQDRVVAEGAFHLNTERNRQALEGQ